MAGALTAAATAANAAVACTDAAADVGDNADAFLQPPPTFDASFRR